MTTDSEHREDPRFPIQLLVSFALGNKPCREDGFTLDLSPFGCCLSVKMPLPLRSDLNLFLSLPDDNSVITIDRAVVRWSMGKRVGIEFIAMSGSDQQRLRRYLDEYGALHAHDMAV